MERKILYDIFYYYYNINNSNNNNNKQMNKTKKDKYLRKNRGNKRGKHKTRKVQSGGKAEAISVREEPSLPNRPDLLKIQPNADGRSSPPPVKAAPTAAPTSPEIRDVELQKKADEEKKMTERADPKFSLLTNTFPNWIMGKFSSIGHDSQVKLGEEIILTDFLKNIGNHIKKTKNQIEEVEYFNDLLLKATQELNKTNDMSPENLDKFNLYIKQIDYNNMFINKTLSDVRTTYEGAIKSGVLQPMPEKPSSPGFFDKIKNTLKGNQKVPNEQNETPGNEKPSFTQRVKQRVSNMGKTVASRFSRKNKSGEEKGLELQGLNNNPEQQSTPTETTPPESTPTETKPTKPTETTLPSTENLQVNNEGTLANAETALPQSGGNKTRKSQQYIREIKQNRTELFNKEMEIINSIRNFKHGHNKDSKKRFMKAVKRA